ncbi:NAD(P)H-dependent oxidoreductase [Allohahella marinimesophila]|uniref:NAD(P)H-dependent oxidoreductase n=1 Tax=Allohahella marinimesophila TaxID=1054972 RepID=A0ABP7NI76_9GAMM
MKLQTIACSTRPGRIGLSIAQWFHEFSSKHGGFDCSLVDLAAFELPVFDEPAHPMLQQYTHDHTKKWSASVSEADAYVFVLPEYNYFPPPSFVNAINYLYREWNYKPCCFVSYGGVSGGLRSAQAAKQLVTTVKMMPMVEGVMIQMAGKRINESKVFQADDHLDSSATAMLDELAKWATSLKTMR